jgi:hypothetical protein
MQKQKRMAPALAMIAVAGFLRPISAHAGDIPQNVRAVLEKTRKTRATYSLYTWNRLGEKNIYDIEEGSAEFHSGDLHRVETPRERIVANCEEMTGELFSVISDKTVEGSKVAGAACGINANADILAAELLGTVQTHFGKAQRVRITDANHVREYDVSKDGVLLRTTYRENRPGGALLVLSEVVKFERSVPDKTMFDKASLSKSYLTEYFEK